MQLISENKKGKLAEDEEQKREKTKRGQNKKRGGKIKRRKRGGSKGPGKAFPNISLLDVP